MRYWLFGGSEGESVIAQLGLAFLRVFTGLSLAFAHGIGKIPPSQGFIERVSGMGFPIPELFAWAAGLSELFGGLLLAVGLLTKPSSFFIMITMAVAGFVRHADDPFASKEKALLFGCVALMYFLVGSGRFGLDAVIGSTLRKK